MIDDQLDAPVTYDAANRWLAGRVNVLTSMTAKQLALSKDFAAQVKVTSFFSAQVADAHILAKLREVSDQYSSGKIGLADARTQLKVYLKGQGYQPDDVSGEKDNVGGSKAVSNLASTARLNLILEQNAAQARAIGDREVSMDPDIMRRYPYVLYLASEAIHKRASHLQYAGLVFKKTDPFLRTHTPPWDYGCLCGLKDIDEEEARRRGGAAVTTAPKDGDPAQVWKIKANGKELDAAIPASGYVFDVEAGLGVCDMSRIADVPVRRAVMENLRSFAKENSDVRFKCVPEGAPLASQPLEGTAKADAIADFLRDATLSPDQARSFSVGNFSSEMRDALGLSEEGTVHLSIGSSDYGLAHNKRHHSAEIENKSFLDILNDALFSSDIQTAMEFRGDRTYLDFYNPRTKALVVTLNTGKGWNDWEIVSMQKAKRSYLVAHGVMKAKEGKAVRGKVLSPASPSEDGVLPTSTTPTA